jgi:hypothetical protein
MDNELIQFWRNYKWALILTLMLILTAYGTVFILGKNNPIELEIEKVLEKEIGFPVDLTP